MKYEEVLCIDQDGQYKEVIHLYDLQQSLVVDHNQNPYEIKLLDMQSNRVLATFNYGYNEEHEGFSFAVSPRHNYLIVKEIEYGQSLDNLNATLYCLKQKKAVEPSALNESTEKAKPHSPYFHSHTHLTFLFSNDIDENTLWVHGRQIDSLDVIDVYEYGDSKVDANASNAMLAQFYKTASYPMVALDSALDNGHVGLQNGLSAKAVVNSFSELKRQENQSLCAFDLAAMSDVIPKMIALCGRDEGSFLSHSLLSSRALKSDTAAFKQALNKLAVPFSAVQDETTNLEYIAIVLPLSSSSAYIKQSIAHISSLCSMYGVIYQGFFIGTNKAVDSWQQALTDSFSHYLLLAEYLDREFVSINTFIELFYQLKRKHQAADLQAYFTESQQQSLSKINIALSQFDDWEMSETTLKEKIKTLTINRQ